MREKLIKSEVVKMFNTSIETLRHYEKKGLLKPEILDNNYRQYDFHDLQTLRQIMMFKDLGLSIEEMKSLNDKVLEENDYATLLKKNQLALEEKINRLNETNENIKHLLELLEDRTPYSFSLRNRNKRSFIVLESVDSDIMMVPKKYYDRFEALISSDYYTESTLQMVYPYDALQTGVVIVSEFCIELPTEAVDTFKESTDTRVLTLDKATYLSVYYPFTHGEFDVFKKHFTAIEDYLERNNLKRIGETVIEKEHPELSLYLGEDITMYELQFAVEKI